MLKIGITGGIATGKSFVLSVFSKEGFYTVKADELAKKLYSFNKELKRKLINKFGENLYKGETVNYSRLEEILFKNQEERKDFSKIFYPEFEIFQDNFFSELSKRYRKIVYESALLFEVGTFKKFDILILTYCKRETQIKRAVKRGMRKGKVEKIIENQYDYKELLGKVDFSLNTDKKKEETQKEVEEIIEKIKSY